MGLIIIGLAANLTRAVEQPLWSLYARVVLYKLSGPNYRSVSRRLLNQAACRGSNLCRSTTRYKQIMSVSTMSGNRNLQPYQPPAWLDGKLKYQPKYKLKLANLPTAIQSWQCVDVPHGFSVDIKRDDCTEIELSGNKIRKLEFILADALDKGCKHVITCGGIQSNHCRATAVAAVRCRLKPHLLLRTDVQSTAEIGCRGNLLLNRLCGARMYIAPRKSPYETHLKPRMEKLAEKIKETTGETTYLICVGGSDSVGIYGYLQAFEELIHQGVLEQYDDIVFACGSGGTATGLALANYLTGSKLKIHGIMVSDNVQYFFDHVNDTLRELGINNVQASEILDLIEGYKGIGYGISTQEELDFITRVAVTTGIMLDPVYSGKAVYGMVREMNKSPDRFQGRRVLFIHTGGLFGLFDGRIEETLVQDGAPTNQIALWNELEDEPPML